MWPSPLLPPPRSPLRALGTLRSPGGWLVSVCPAGGRSWSWCGSTRTRAPTRCAPGGWWHTPWPVHAPPPAPAPPRAAIGSQWVQTPRHGNPMPTGVDRLACRPGAAEECALQLTCARSWRSWPQCGLGRGAGLARQRRSHWLSRHSAAAAVPIESRRTALASTLGPLRVDCRESLRCVWSQ
jgi:hypothetical protein